MIPSALSKRSLVPLWCDISITLFERLTGIGIPRTGVGLLARRLIVLFLEIESFAHDFDGEFFESMSRFGIGTLPRESNAAVRGRSQEVYDFNHQAVRYSPKRKRRFRPRRTVRYCSFLPKTCRYPRSATIVAPMPRAPHGAIFRSNRQTPW